MGTLLLDVALFVSAALLIPPAFIVASKGPIDGIRELVGEDSITAYDEESYVLKHIVFIDCAKNWFLAALYLAAITMEAAAKEKVAILAILLMLLVGAVQVIAPAKESIAPYPSLEGITGNPVFLPICGTQIVLLTLGVLFASRYEECRGAQASHYGRFVNIASASGALSWTVGKDGVLGTTRHHPANATFLVEYRGGDKTWFCLRALPELRVVEAVPPRGGPQEWMLRLGRIGCTGAAEQLFQYRGRSMYSKGVDGYVNLRDWQHLRVHGDRMPWTPMRKESRMTRVSVEVVGETAAEAVAVNERLLALVSNFDADAQRSTAVPG